MLSIDFIRSNPDKIRQALIRRGAKESVTLVDDALTTDRSMREALTLQQTHQHSINTESRTIGTLMQAGKKEEAAKIIQRQKHLKKDVRELGQTIAKLEHSLTQTLLTIANVPHESVPDGLTDVENVVIAHHGKKPSFDFTPLPHWELTNRHYLVDFERGAKVAGAGFPFYVDGAAKLHRELINFFLGMATTSDYTEMRPPLFVNATSAQGTGQLPDKEGQMYQTADEFYPIPTAEVPLTNYFRDEILSQAELPIKLCAHSPCWRREAGSYGSHVRGLNRLHQFDKVEIVQFTNPDISYLALEEMRIHVEGLLRILDLPYRCLLMCAGELGFNQAKQYDLEVWSAGQKRWLEVSSISNFTDYQARRLNIRFRPDGGGKPQLIHTLNGSALALPRIIAALLENNQTEDGSFEFPDVLDRISPNSVKSFLP